MFVSKNEQRINNCRVKRESKRNKQDIMRLHTEVAKEERERMIEGEITKMIESVK